MDLLAPGKKFKAEIYSNGSVRTVYVNAGKSARAARDPRDPLQSLGLEPAKYSDFLVSTVPAPSAVCTICSEDLESRATSLVCGHTFHAQCILAWAWDNVTCPNCRKEIGADPPAHPQ